MKRVLGAALAAAVLSSSVPTPAWSQAAQAAAKTAGVLVPVVAPAPVALAPTAPPLSLTAPTIGLPPSAAPAVLPLALPLLDAAVAASAATAGPAALAAPAALRSPAALPRLRAAAPAANLAKGTVPLVEFAAAERGEAVEERLDALFENRAARSSDPAGEVEGAAAPEARAPLGKPGPGVGPEHLKALQELADATGRPWLVAGSRQAGSSHTGEPHRPDADLDLGVIGTLDDLLAARSAPWHRVPDVRHAPVFARATVEEALAEGFVVVLPEKASPPEPAPPQEEPSWTARLRTAGAVAVVVAAADAVTKLAAHAFGTPDLHLVHRDALWQAGSLLVAILPLGLAIPSMVLGLARRYRVPQRLQKGLVRIAGIFPVVVGLVAGGSIANTIEGEWLGRVTNPFVLLELASNLADHALFGGAMFAIQLSAYLLFVYAWARRGARVPHPFKLSTVALLSLGSAAFGYLFGPLLSNREFLGGAEAVGAFFAEPGLWAQFAFALAVAWMPGAGLRRWVARHSGYPELIRRAERYRPVSALERLSASPRAPGDAFEFAVLGDAEPGRFWWTRRLFGKKGVFERLLSSAQGSPVDFTVQLGDMVSRGTADNFGRFLALLDRVSPNKPYLMVLGNHDRHNPHRPTNAHLFETLFGAPNYFFDRGGVRFVVLDSSSGRVTRRQLQWLDQALDVEGPKIVFTHIPPVQLHRFTDFPGAKGAGGFKHGAREFTEIVARRGVARVYLGHVHALDAMDYMGVRYVLTGGGGSPLYPHPIKTRLHHSLRVRVENGRITETVHPLHGDPFRL